MIEIFTDGACAGNPGPGGWGVLIRENGKLTELSGGDSATTNNRMEMTAAIEALKAVAEGAQVVLYTDSQYLKLGITEWLPGWRRRGWKKGRGGAVKNRDLWEALDRLSSTRRVDWRWLRGHAGHPENERADALARQGLKAVTRGSRRE
jgi:ribonuclease HI